MAPTLTPVTHVVLFRYRSTIPWQTLESHFKSFSLLRTTCLNAAGNPYMLSLRMGKNTSWENFARGMTHVFILEFRDEADRDYYLLRDPVHRAFSEGATSLIEDSVVVDFKGGVLFGEISGEEEQEEDGKGRSMNGSCHCGEIKFVVRLNENRHIICHCRTCQLLGGGPYSCNAVVSKDALKVKEGKLSVYTYTGASGKPVLCYHCGNCTSHVYHHQMANPEQIIVRTLLLEGGDKMGVGGEIFTEGKLGWVQNLKEALAT